MPKVKIAQAFAQADIAVLHNDTELSVQVVGPLVILASDGGDEVVTFNGENDCIFCEECDGMLTAKSLDGADITLGLYKLRPVRMSDLT